jgi:hypothetical protein
MWPWQILVFPIVNFGITFDISVSIDYCLEIDEWQLHPMTCDAPGVVFFLGKWIFLSCEPKLKPFRTSTFLIQMGKARDDI